MPVGNLRTGGQTPDYRRRNRAARRAGRRAGQIPRHRRRHRRAGKAGLPGAGQGRLAGRRIPGHVRDPDEPAHRRRICVLPRPTFESNAVTEPNNFVEPFIDSSGVVSWRFFSAKADYEFVEWDFSGHGENSNVDEAATLFGILEAMGKEVYVAAYDQLGATACRILVPGYSEIYPVDDLIWDNTNKALAFREDILNLHRLDDARLAALLERLEESELDDYTDIITLIGVEFDENTAWGQLTILELKLLINLALQDFDSAKDQVDAYLQYNENTVDRGLFDQAMRAVLEVILDDELELDDYVANFRQIGRAS